MAGTVMVWAEAPPLRKAGKLTVVIDGVKAGLVQQGEVELFAVEQGTHTVRVGGRSGKSNTVTVEVADGGTSRVANRGTGLGTAAAFVPLLALLGLIPGVIFRLQIQTRQTAPADPPGSGAGGSSSGSTGANGLWWESDPVLSKRYKAAGSAGADQ